MTGLEKHLFAANLTIDKFLKPNFDASKTALAGKEVLKCTIKPKVNRIGKLMTRTLIGDHDSYVQGKDNQL